MIAIGETVGTAEWIIDDTCLVCPVSFSILIALAFITFSDSVLLLYFKVLGYFLAGVPFFRSLFRENCIWEMFNDSVCEISKFQTNE